LAVERDVLEGFHEEVESEAMVEVREQVAIERRGDAERVVVRRVEDRTILLRVDADEQAASGPRRALRMDRGEEAHRLPRREVADARSGIEEERRPIVEDAAERQAVLEIRDDARHLDLREIRRHAI